MTAKICNANRPVQRVSVFVTKFFRRTYGFLTLDHVTELRTFRNEIKNDYLACPLIRTPRKNDKKQAPDTETKSESDLDLPPPQKRSRKLSDSTPDKEERAQSIFKDSTSPENSDPFETPAKKSVDSE